MPWLPTEITAIVQETPMDRSFTLRIPPEASDAFAFHPGQFVLVRDPEHEESGQRAYTISSAPDQSGGLDVTVRDMGRFGHDFYDYGVGKDLLIRPPQGRFLLDVEPDGELVMVSGGSGVTPFRAFVRHMRAHEHPRRAVLVQSSRDVAQLIYREEFERHAADCDWFSYLPTVTRAADDDPWTGRRGRVDAGLLAAEIEDPARTLFYACGPGSFVKAMLGMAAEIGVPADRRRKEQWG
jgi:ferredoxin-NADP reductase